MHPNVIWIVSLGSVLVFSMIDDKKVIYFCFCIQFFMEHVSIVFQRALAFVIERKITLVEDVCFKPLIIFRSHDFHVGDIRGVVNEIASYH